MPLFRHPVSFSASCRGTIHLALPVAQALRPTLTLPNAAVLATRHSPLATIMVEDLDGENTAAPLNLTGPGLSGPRVNGAHTEAIEPTMAHIPEGWFEMGCESGRDDEKPVHRVWVAAFELAAYQVTNAEYVRFLAATGGAPLQYWNDANFNDPQMPVVAVSWHEATSYCDWLSGAAGKRYRLPSEAEWERAARGGAEGLLYPWGDAPPEMVPDYAMRWKLGPEPVGLYTPNAYGLCNMGDNVHEWCADWYDDSYYASSTNRNPQGPKSGTRKASRGGSWRHHIKVTRVAARSSIPPEFQYADYGFRIARALTG